MTELQHTHLRRVLTLLPRDILSMLQEQHGLFLGGGFIREVVAGNQAVDVDLFYHDADALEAFSFQLKDKRNSFEFTRVHKTDNAMTVLTKGRIPVQFIKRWLFSDPEKLVKSFDFTVCQAVVWFDHEEQKWKSRVNDTFYPDLASRMLVYTTPQRIEEAGGSLLRVIKFVRRGYVITPVELGKVVARLARAHNRLKETDEVEVAQVFSGLMLEVDPLTVIDGLDVTETNTKIGDLE